MKSPWDIVLGAGGVEKGLTNLGVRLLKWGSDLLDDEGTGCRDGWSFDIDFVKKDGEMYLCFSVSYFAGTHCPDSFYIRATLDGDLYYADLDLVDAALYSRNARIYFDARNADVENDPSDFQSYSSLSMATWLKEDCEGFENELRAAFNKYVNI